jgi:recombination-promoting nuclease RpnB
VSIQIHNPHDTIFKKFFSDIDVARTFIRSYLDPVLQKKCNLTSLKIEPGSFIEEALSQQHSDILYSLKIDGVKGYAYINVEHQSSPNKLMPFRMLRYKLAIMKQHLDQGHKKLPTVISMLFYHGKKGPYPYSLSLIDCFEDPDYARQHFLNDPILVDLSQIPDETFEKHHKLGLLELVQKHIFHRDLEKIAKRLIGITRKIQPDHESFHNLVYYMFVAGETANVSQAIKTLKSIEAYKEDVMNAAHQLQQQGLKQGLEQGRREEDLVIAKRMLNMGADHDFIKKATGLSDQDLIDLEN